MRVRLVCTLALLAQVAASELAIAQLYPTRPVRILVGYPAGGVVDLMARSFQEPLSTELGQPVIVEARPGANGSIATETVARSEPDGHTLLLGVLSHTINPHLTKVPWHPVRDFKGIAMIGAGLSVLAVTASLPVRSFAEFKEYAKDRPDALNYMLPGRGTSMHMGMEMLMRHTGLRLRAVSYKGVPPAVTDLVRGEIHAGIFPIGQILPHIEAGSVAALAVVAPHRVKELPAVPTLTEAGFEGPQIVLPWYALLSPASTPSNATERLSGAMRRVLALPEVKSAIENLGNITLPSETPEYVDRLLAQEHTRWGQFIEETGIKLDN